MQGLRRMPSGCREGRVRRLLEGFDYCHMRFGDGNGYEQPEPGTTIIKPRMVNEVEDIYYPCGFSTSCGYSVESGNPEC